MNRIISNLLTGLIGAILSAIMLAVILYCMGWLVPSFAPIGFLIVNVVVSALLVSAIVPILKKHGNLIKYLLGGILGALLGIILLTLITIFNILGSFGEGYYILCFALIIVSIMGGITGLVTIWVCNLNQEY